MSRVPCRFLAQASFAVCNCNIVCVTHTLASYISHSLPWLHTSVLCSSIESIYRIKLNITSHPMLFSLYKYLWTSHPSCRHHSTPHTAPRFITPHLTTRPTTHPPLTRPLPSSPVSPSLSSSSTSPQSPPRPSTYVETLSSSTRGRAGRTSIWPGRGWWRGGVGRRRRWRVGRGCWGSRSGWGGGRRVKEWRRGGGGTVKIGDSGQQQSGRRSVSGD